MNPRLRREWLCYLVTLCAREHPEWLKAGIDALGIEMVKVSDALDECRNLARSETV